MRNFSDMSISTSFPGREKEPGSVAEIINETHKIIDEHFAALSEQLERVRRLLSMSKALDAAVNIQAAADFATTNHTGLYASEDLENTLGYIGRNVIKSVKPSRSLNNSRSSDRKVFHILTTAYDIGGHTRLVWRWIERDQGRQHSVVLTHQRHRKVPPQLIKAVTNTGGKVYRLDASPSGLFERARHLANLKNQADLIVLHAHPFDVVPPLAFSSKDAGPPVVLFNHADHVFWLGRNFARLVVDFRPSTLKFDIARRQVPAGHLATLPIPLDMPERTLSRAKAKESLGITAGTKVLLSIAAAYKYAPIGYYDFVKVLTPVLQKSSNAMLLVVGPEPDGRWLQASKETDGRIVALGQRANLGLLHQAADIYLDSFPFGSLTALLEAGSYGTPVLAFAPFDLAGPMGHDSAVLPNSDLCFSDLTAYTHKIEELLGDGGQREMLGKEGASHLERTNTGSAWKLKLEEIYTFARAISPMPQLERQNREVELPDLLLTALNLSSGRSRTVDRALNEHLQLLPFHSRVRHVFGEQRGKQRLGLLLSDWLGQQYEIYITGKRHG